MSPKDFPQIQTTMSNQQYCLKWNNHQVNLLRAFDRLLQSESFTDVTLACEGRSLRAHKVVLSACSSYFETLFEEHPDKSPIIILKDMKFAHVSQLVNFMYRGEINITQDMLSGLLRTAETLKIKGLAEVSGEQSSAAAAAAAAVAAAHQFSPIAPNFRIGTSLPQMITNHSSVLTAALNAPVSTASLAPLAAFLNPDILSQATLEEKRASLLKRISQDDDSGDNEPMSKVSRREEIKCESPTQSLSPLNMGSLSNGTQSSLSQLGGMRLGDSPQQHNKPILPAPSSQKQSKNQTNPTSPGQPVLTPIPHDLTVNAQQELPDFLQGYSVYRLNDYLGFRTRQQFWEEPAVRRIMEGIKNKEIDMKSAAEILGVSYGTLYGRYREVFGYLKHAWVNKPGRSPSSSVGHKERNIWDESRSQDLIQKVLSKELSLTAAAVRLGIDYNTFFAHLTDNGKNQSRVSLLSRSSSTLEDDRGSSAIRKTEKEEEEEDDASSNNGLLRNEYEDEEEEEEEEEKLRKMEEVEEEGEELDEEIEEEEEGPMEDSSSSFPPPPTDDILMRTSSSAPDNEEDEEGETSPNEDAKLNGEEKSLGIDNDQPEMPRLIEKVN